MFIELENKKYIIFIFILLLLLLVYLYINNIIGLFDLIALVLIFGIYLFLTLNIVIFRSVINTNYVLFLFSLTIVAPITSFIYNLN